MIITKKKLLPVKSFKDCFERIVKKTVIENPNKARSIMLESDEVYERRMRRRLNDFFSPIKSFTDKGLLTLRESLERLNKEDPDCFPIDSLFELEKLRSNKSPEEDPEIFNALLNGMLSLYEFYHIDDETLEIYYKVAERLMDENSNSAALEILFLLVGLKPEEATYWLALGNLYYFEKNYHEALAAYGFAILHDPNDLQPYFYSIHCYIYLKDLHSAGEIVELVLGLIAESPELDEEWRTKLETLRGTL